MKFIISLILLFISFNIHAGSSIAGWLADIGQPKYTAENIENNFSTKRVANGRNVFIFDPNKHLWAVYNKYGNLVGKGRASGGKDYCSDIRENCRTVVGEFTVFRKEDKECTSHTFPIDEGGGAPMPHCMFFHQGYAIHGSEKVPNKNISHGCIRIAKRAAEWMNKHYIQPGSMVIVLPYNTTA